MNTKHHHTTCLRGRPEAIHQVPPFVHHGGGEHEVQQLTQIIADWCATRRLVWEGGGFDGTTKQCLSFSEFTACFASIDRR